MRKPRYGELRTLHVPTEVGVIWRSRNDEPEEEEPIYMRADYETSPADDEMMDLGRRVWGLVKDLTPRQEMVLILRYAHDMTLQEVGDALELTKETIRRIEKEAIRKLRRTEMVGAILHLLPHRRAVARHPGFAWESEL